MSKEMRIGERRKLKGSVEMLLPDRPNPVTVNGLDVSPSAVALLVPVEHKAMKSIPKLLKPGNPVTLTHDLFGDKEAVLHRIFRHRNGNSKWVFSFLQNIKYRS